MPDGVQLEHPLIEKVKGSNFLSPCLLDTKAGVCWLLVAGGRIWILKKTLFNAGRHGEVIPVCPIAVWN